MSLNTEKGRSTLLTSGNSECWRHDSAFLLPHPKGYALCVIWIPASLLVDNVHPQSVCSWRNSALFWPRILTDAGASLLGSRTCCQSPFPRIQTGPIPSWAHPSQRTAASPPFRPQYLANMCSAGGFTHHQDRDVGGTLSRSRSPRCHCCGGDINPMHINIQLPTGHHAAEWTQNHRRHQQKRWTLRSESRASTPS